LDVGHGGVGAGEVPIDCVRQTHDGGVDDVGVLRGCAEDGVQVVFYFSDDGFVGLDEEGVGVVIVYFNDGSGGRLTVIVVVSLLGFVVVGIGM